MTPCSRAASATRPRPRWLTEASAEASAPRVSGGLGELGARCWGSKVKLGHPAPLWCKPVTWH